MINAEKYKEECLGFLKELIQTPSVNGKHNEKPVVDLIADKARDLGFNFQVFEKEGGRPNIYIGKENLFKSNKELLMVSHSDTVPAGEVNKWNYNPFSAEEADGRVYGRGALDCKGGIATSMYALKALYDSGYTDNAKIAIGVDEESGADSSLGLKYMLENGLNGEGCVYTYGGKIKSSLTIGHRGVLRIWVYCSGESAHSGSKEWQNGLKGASALMALNSFLQDVEKISFKTESNQYFPDYNTQVTPTLIEAGSGESLVPDKAKALLDVRTMPGQDNKEIINKLKNVATEHEDDKISFDFEVKNDVPAALSDPSSPFIESASRVMKEVYETEDEISFKGSGPANEGHMFINQGIPTIIGFGPQGDGFHSKNECAEIDSLEKSIEFLTSLAVKQ